jgi:hypothetical protein
MISPKRSGLPNAAENSLCPFRKHRLPFSTQFCGKVMLECGHGQSAALQLPVKRLDEQALARAPAAQNGLLIHDVTG